VLIAGLGTVFMPNKLATNVDKAQTIAAQHVLRELGVHFDGMMMIVMVTSGPSNLTKRTRRRRTWTVQWCSPAVHPT